MCRMAAYLGPTIRLDQFLTRPAHSLVVQSYAPKELVYAKVNADGYGFGWYDANSQAVNYRCTMPIWSDPNLENLGRGLESDLWLAYIRSATEGSSVNHANTQPFYDDELLFMHNGYIEDFTTQVRHEISDYLSNDIRAGIQGTTDSEYLFAILRELLSSNKDLSIEEACSTLFDLLAGWLGDTTALLNFIITDGELIYAIRHGHNHDSPSLYYTTDDELFPDAQLVSSEPLTHGELWQPVPDHHILILSNDEPPELFAL